MKKIFIFFVFLLMLMCINKSTAQDGLIQTLGLGTLQDVKYSPDGKTIASSGSRGIILWNAESGEINKIIAIPEYSIYTFEWSPDGSKIAFIDPDYILHIYNISKGSEIWEIKNICQFIWSPDGSKIAVHENESSTFKFLGADSGVVLKKIKGNTFSIIDCWSPDGSKIVLIFGDYIEIWDADKGSKIWSLINIHSFSWNPDGSMFACSSVDYNFIIIKDVNTNLIKFTLLGHDNPIISISWSPDGSKIASCSFDGSLKLWNVNTGDEIRTMYGEILNYFWSPDGSKIFCNNSIFDADTGIEICNFDSINLNSICWSPDGSRIISDNIIWDTYSGSKIKTLIGFNIISICSWSLDGSKFAIDWSNQIKIYDTNNWKEITTIVPKCKVVNKIAWNQNGTKIASINYYSDSIEIFDVTSGSMIYTLNNCSYYEWSPDGRLLAGWDIYNNSIKIFDASTGTEILTIKNCTSHAESMIWSPDGTKIAFVGYQSQITQIFDIKTGNELCHFNKVIDIEWSSDGSKFAAISNDSLVIFDATTGSQIKALIDNEVYLRCFRWSPDGSKIYYPSTDFINPKIIVLDVNTGKIIKSCRLDRGFESIFLSSDGLKIAGLGRLPDYVFKLFDENSLTEVKTFKGHKDDINELSWSPDGTKIASSSKDGTIKIWDANYKIDFVNEHSINFLIEEILAINPNPVVDFINIQFNKNQEPKSIKIINLFGDVVYQLNDINFQNELNVDIQNLASGLYQVIVNQQNGKILASKFLKN